MIARCSSCGEPAHPTETDDLERCSSCSPRIVLKLTPAQRSAVEIYVTDPAHECQAFALRGSWLEVLAEPGEAARVLTEAANSADEDGPRSGVTALCNLAAIVGRATRTA